MLYVYRRSNSTGARDLSRALGGRRIFTLPHLTTNDVVVCWGESTTVNGPKILNGTAIRSKLNDAIKLKEAGVATVEVSTVRPVAPATQLPPPIDPAIAVWERAQQMAEDFTALRFHRSQVMITGVMELGQQMTLLSAALRIAAPVAGAVRIVPDTNWVGRSSHHTGGLDLLNPPTVPDYWVKKETLIREFRVHSFKGRSIRAGEKIHREGVATPSAWIRSWDGGWKISYNGNVRQIHRDLAHKAVETLGLDFGAVDIGEKAGGGLIVLEVNRAPGLEGGTIDAYQRAIQDWVGGN